MRDRNLTGPWAGFSFKGGRLVTPEGRELYPEDLAWLSLTAAQAQEWRRMMDQLRGKSAGATSGNRCGTRLSAGALAAVTAEVVTLSTLMANRKKRSAVVVTGPDAEPPAAVLPVPGPRRRQRV